MLPKRISAPPPDREPSRLAAASNRFQLAAFHIFAFPHSSQSSHFRPSPAGPAPIPRPHRNPERIQVSSPEQARNAYRAEAPSGGRSAALGFAASNRAP